MSESVIVDTSGKTKKAEEAKERGETLTSRCAARLFHGAAHTSNFISGYHTKETEEAEETEETEEAEKIIEDA